MGMKISGSINSLYSQQQGYAKNIDKVLSSKMDDWCKEHGWFFEHRIKEVESYAQKIEQSYIGTVEDVYASTIIVRNKSEVVDCYTKLKDSNNRLGIRYIKMRPESLEITKSRPNIFEFDSIRMYFKPPIPIMGTADYIDEIFEIQIKTLLEHSWDKAAHLSIYKSNGDVSWAKTRLVAQIKAMLETAELALIETESLSKSVVLQKENLDFENKNRISKIYTSTWPMAELPHNINRLSDNTIEFLKYINKDTAWLEELLKKECLENRGPKILNLSPYWIIVQASIRQLGWVSFLDALKKNHRFKKNKLPLIKELDFPELLNITINDPVYLRD
jgi:ppGpp synthetase/RelA/SpoT-type nucleotidyltranferase